MEVAGEATRAWLGGRDGKTPFDGAQFLVTTRELPIKGPF